MDKLNTSLKNYINRDITKYHDYLRENGYKIENAVGGGNIVEYWSKPELGLNIALHINTRKGKPIFMLRFGDWGNFNVQIIQENADIKNHLSCYVPLLSKAIVKGLGGSHYYKSGFTAKYYRYGRADENANLLLEKALEKIESAIVEALEAKNVQLSPTENL